MKWKPRFEHALLIGCILFSAACSLTMPDREEIEAQKITPTATQNPQPTPLPSPPEVKFQGTIRIWHSWNESERNTLALIIKDFNEIYPDVFFDVLYIPSEYIQARYESEIREGYGPALLLGPAEWGPALFDAGLVADLEGTLQDSLLATINKPALDAARYHDALIGLPYSMQGIVLYRNEDISTLIPTSFEELISLAQTSTQGEQIGAILERSFFYSGAHLSGIGGQWMDSNGLPAFNNDKGLAWIELLRTFDQAGPANFLTDQDLEFFKSGRVGWIIDGTWNLQALTEAMGPENLNIDPWPPCAEGRLSGYVLPEMMYMSNRTEGDNLTSTIKFIEYFLSPQAQANLAGAGRIPVINNLPLTNPENKLISQAMAALAGGTAYPILPETTLYATNVDVALRAVFQEGVPPDQALNNAEEAIIAAIQQGQATPTP